MSDENVTNGGEEGQEEVPAQSATQIDAESIRNEMASLRSELLGTVRDLLGNNKSAEPARVSAADSVDWADPDIKADVEELGLSESQLKALINIQSKMAEKNIIPTIETRIDNKARATQVDQELAEKFPDVLKANSPLLRAAQVAYENLDPSVKGTPSGKKLAIYEAAQKLGISPRKVNPYNTEHATNPSGGDTPPKKDPEKQEDEALLGFASMFGLTQDQMKSGIDTYKSTKAFAKK